jgi:hypothetical protein
MTGVVSYLLPMQFLGPTEKGCSTSFASDAKRESPSQRSGIKEFGSRKFFAVW